MDIEESGHHVRCQWFALRVKSRSEKRVATIMRNKGYEEFVSFYRPRRVWLDPIKLAGLPLFPGYVFCRLDPQYRFPILVTPGVLYFVGVERTFAPIKEGEIRAIQSAVIGLPAEPWPSWRLDNWCGLRTGP